MYAAAGQLSDKAGYQSRINLWGRSEMDRGQAQLLIHTLYERPIRHWREDCVLQEHIYLSLSAKVKVLSSKFSLDKHTVAVKEENLLVEL
jgi:hypothetical protein